MEKDLFSTIPMQIEPVDAEKVFRSKNVVMAYTEEELKKELETKEYEYGFYTDIESDTFPVGLNEDIIRAISKRKEAFNFREKRRTRLDDRVAVTSLYRMERNGGTRVGKCSL